MIQKIDAGEFQKKEAAPLMGFEKPKVVREDFPEASIPVQGGAPAKEKIEVPSEFPAEDAKTSVKSMQEEFDKVLAGRTSDVKVTDEEKALFLKAMLNDQPIKFEIVGFGGHLKIVFRCRRPQETEAIFLQLKRDLQQNRIELDSAYYSKLHRYALAVQIVQVNGEDMPTYESFKPSPEDTEKQIGNIALAAQQFVEHQNEAYISAHVSMLAAFEQKISFMSSQLLNGDFWIPASTS